MNKLLERKSYNVYLDSTEIRCKSSSVLTSNIYKYLEENNHSIVNSMKHADYIILNTCGADSFREKTSIKRISLYKKNSKKSVKIIFIGCLTKINKDLLDDYSSDIITIQNNDSLDDIFLNNIKYNEVNVRYIDNRIYDKLLIPLHDGAFGIFSKRFEKVLRGNWQSKRFHVEISQGCAMNCSFCAIPNARGRKVTSREINSIIEDIDNHYKDNKIITLVADDCGSYGTDNDSSLPELLHQINSKYPRKPIDIYYINPFWLEKNEEDYFEVFKELNIASINISIQSGSNRIIKKMNRRYDMCNVKKIIKKIRKQSPGTVIITHMMIGFPGERFKDFLYTLSAISYFDFCNPIIYTDRPGTKSFDMQDKNSYLEKLIKHKILTLLCIAGFLFRKSIRIIRRC